MTTTSLLHAQRFTVAQAAAKLGVSQATLANWRTQGKGPVYMRIGRTVFYFEEDLEAYFQEERKKVYAHQKTGEVVPLPIHSRGTRVRGFDGITGHRSQPQSR
jgi:transcriptional regulator with XRE-family HTH domain